MLKMYHKQAHSGSSPSFWEGTWVDGHFEESVRFSAVDPLRPLFEEYLGPESLMLEGGCGMGNYISYYAARGYKVIGLDFALGALKTLHARQPRLLLTGGDVSKLPFADETFDLYYSGGVVEHFEGGADESLQEARRVLKEDGVLLISVPYYSPLRKALRPFRKDDWHTVAGPASDNGHSSKDRHFFQYAYTRKEFTSMLAEAGLRVLKTQGYAVMWGLYEIPFLNPDGKSEFAASTTRASKNQNGAVEIDPLVRDQQISLLKRLVVSEDDTVPLLGLGVKFMRWSAANMMMYVCKRI